MAAFRRIEVYQTIIDSGLVPLYYNGDVKVMKKAVTACVEGGAKVFEFTNRGDGAYQVFEPLLAFCRKEFPDLILGVGSVVDQGTGALYISSGADFVVGSLFNPDLARLCNRRKIGYIPGCATPTEIATAEGTGAEIVKVFPGSTVGGPKFVRSVLAPTPWSLIMPTGGVKADPENLRGWFEAGVCAVGMGSALFQKEAVRSGNYDQIRELVQQSLAWISEIRESLDE
jgi:2-dehydro-3-deoxyphosphogluconate aldolase/(4S)-4-hydroxy-2-oxoglutarate aldolase